MPTTPTSPIVDPVEEAIAKGVTKPGGFVTPCDDEELLFVLDRVLGEEGCVTIEKAYSNYFHYYRFHVQAESMFGGIRMAKTAMGASIRWTLEDAVIFKGILQDPSKIRSQDGPLPIPLWKYLEPCLVFYKESKLRVHRYLNPPEGQSSHAAYLQTPYYHAVGFGNTLYDAICEALMIQARHISWQYE